MPPTQDSLRTEPEASVGTLQGLADWVVGSNPIRGHDTRYPPNRQNKTMSCKTTKVVGWTGDPSTADTTIAIPTRQSRREKKCNCARIRGKHQRTSECIDLYHD